MIRRLVLSLIVLATLATTVLAQVHVQGHFRRDGTYVQPHYRSVPDGNPSNNWSTRGNLNPYTGQSGTRDPSALPPLRPLRPLGR